MMKITSLRDLQPFREQMLALADEHGAGNVRVFGSVARGEANENSLLVTWDYERVSAWGGTGLDIALEALLGRPVDVISDAGLSPYLKDDILAEAIPL